MASKSSVATKAAPTKAKAAPPKDADTPEKEGAETPEKDGPLPLLDLSDAAVKKMIKQAKKRGYVTYEQLNAVMPSEEVTSEKIEDVLAIMNEMGINVVETEEAEAEEEEKDEPEEEESESGELVEVAPKAVAKSEAKEPTERTDDPVRMYLREMGSVELLSREGEIAIAKRIEAGREAMIAGLCESPLTFQAVIIWRDELNEGKVFLRDIIDLEATYAGPDAKQVAPAVGPDGLPLAPGSGPGAPGFVPQPPQAVAPPSAPPAATPFKPAGANGAAAAATARRAARKRRWPTPISTRTISRTRCRLPRSRPSSSPKCWRPSTTSPTRSSGCAACRSSTSRASCTTRRCRRPKSASRRSSRKRSSRR